MILLTLLLCCLQQQQKTYSLDQTLSAIKQVEVGSSNGVGVIGDEGKAFGPFQIHKDYWIDSGIPGKHEQCLKSYDYSRRVVIAYMVRYAPEAMGRLKIGKGTLADVEKIARIHNGGPSGFEKKATLPYWQKVREIISP